MRETGQPLHGTEPTVAYPIEITQLTEVLADIGPEQPPEAPWE